MKIVFVGRIFFFGRDGNVLKDIVNVNQPKFNYYYTNEKEVVDAMKTAIEAEKRIKN